MPGSISHGRGPLRPQRFYIPLPPWGIGEPRALASSLVGVGLAAATLTVTHNLVASPAGVGVPVGNISGPDHLAGAVTGVGKPAASALSLKHNLAAGPIGVGTVSAAWGSFIWGLDGWGVVRLDVAHHLVANGVGVGRPVGSPNYIYHLVASPTGVARPTAILALRHNLVAAVVGVSGTHGPAAPTTLRIALVTREGTFVWPEDSYEAARRDQVITRVEAEKV